MGFWDKVKSFFGGASPPGGGDGGDGGNGDSDEAPPLFNERGLPTDAFTQFVERRVRVRAKKEHLFTRHDIARIVVKKLESPPSAAETFAANAVLKLKKAGLFEELGYECSYSSTVRGEVFHPEGTDPDEYPGAGGGPPSGVRRVQPQPVAPVAPAAPPPPRPATPAAAAPARAPTTPYRSNPFDAGQSLGMSADELRRRAMKIVPWRTPWIGRVDVIPPASDERTALIDRGLVLRGYFTEEQIAEFHRIGDLWLEHKDAASFVAARGKEQAKLDLEALKQKKLQEKAEKKRAAAERRERLREAIAKRRAEDIVFLGRGFSGKLADRRSDVEALERAGLPVLSTPADVARAMELSIPTLRWLAFHSDAAETIHYRQFEVPKKTGGVRLLSSPLPKLAQAQQWILENVLAKIPTGGDAHGFVPGRSTVSNAKPHVGRDVVVNVDLRDFFPSIHFPRVRGLFESLGYSPAVASILALLTTEAPRRRVVYAQKPYWVAAGPRGLPQGACTSPAVSNLVARKLDTRLAAMSAKHGARYTRYADDLTLSLEPGRRDQIGMLLARIRHIAEDEGFTVHPDKVFVQRAGGRQLVTGIVVNRGLSVPREELRRLRAVLHAAKKTGLEAQNRDGLPDFRAHLRGKIGYVMMVDREKGSQLLRALEATPP
ncbi:MAG: RNA-directed DNA polymerase [Polyangiaceae bacterium]|nr:RNA-directed DNA polymerase [Polyangiaceae bacterium]